MTGVPAVERGVNEANEAPAPEEAGGVSARDQLNAAILASATGDRVAFRALYDLTAAQVLGIARAVLRRQDLAEDVAQEVFVTIWRRAPGYDPTRGSPFAWIAAITRNRAIDRLRADRASGAVGTDDLPELADPFDSAGAVLDSLTVNRLLGKLSPEQRRVLLLAYFRGYTHIELAEKLGVPLGTVKSWLKRGLEAMREALS